MNFFKFRRSALALVGACVGSAALAEGSSTAIDISAATGALTSMQTAVESYWTAAQPFVIAIVGIVVVATLIWAGVRLFKGGTSKISGR